MKRQAHRAQRRAGETAQKVAANADLLLALHPPRAETALLFNPLATGRRRAKLQQSPGHGDATAGYHPMFFERNLPLDILNAWVLCAFIARLLMGGLPN